MLLRSLIVLNSVSSQMGWIPEISKFMNSLCAHHAKEIQWEASQKGAHWVQWFTTWDAHPTAECVAPVSATLLPDQSPANAQLESSGPGHAGGDPHLNSWLWPSSWSNLSCCVRLGSEPTARSVFMWKVKKWRSWVKSMEKGIKSLSVVQNHLKIHTYFCYMHFLPSSRTPWLRV